VALVGFVVAGRTSHSYSEARSSLCVPFDVAASCHAG
jgi:hypothetical protein